jgi:hypothetical protein
MSVSSLLSHTNAEVGHKPRLEAPAIAERNEGLVVWRPRTLVVACVC